MYLFRTLNESVLKDQNIELMPEYADPYHDR